MSLLRASVSRIVLCALPILGAATVVRAADTDAAASRPTQLDEVVVTAAKREMNLEKIPQAVSVLNGEVQRERGQQRLEDIQTSVPNVTFTSTSDNSQLYIRGVGNTFINAGGDPGVAFYQDGAYVSDQRTTNTSLFDTERVEILRGPQGALYGRNAVGGALNIISAKPTDDLEGRVDVLGGDHGRREGEGFLSGPLGDTGVDGRLSFQARHTDGYTRNLLAGQGDAPKRLDDLDSYAVRGQLTGKLPTDGRLTLLVSYFHQADAGPALSVVPSASFIYPAQALFGVRPSSDPRAVYANFGRDQLKVGVANLNFVQPLGTDTLTVNLNYRSGKQYFLNDCDGTPAAACRYTTDTSDEDYYAEAYLSSGSEGRFRWLIGASAVKFLQSQAVDVQWQSLMAYLAPGTPTNVPFAIHYLGGGHLHTDSAAAYADLHYQLNDTWALSGQIRYSETTKKAVEFQIIPSFGVNVPASPNSLRNTSTPFKVGVEGQLTPDILVYGSYATAEKDGAINIGALQTATVKPEKVKNGELGAKATFLDRRLQVNGAIFDSDYQNLQIAQVVGTVATLANAPKARIRGAELEVVALPVEGLRLSASYGYLDGEFLQFSNSQTLPGLVSGPLQNLAGNRLPYVPRSNLNLDAQYKFPVADRLEASLDAQYAWRSTTYFNEFNDPTNAASAGGVANLAASIGTRQTSWRLYGYVHNLFNRTYPTGSTIYSGLLGGEKAVSYAPPRNFGVGLSYSF